MAIFRYTAIDPQGALHRGELSADSQPQVRTALRRMALEPQTIREQKLRWRRTADSLAVRGTLAGTNFSPRDLMVRASRNRRRWHLIELYENLAALLASGTPLAQSLDLLAGSARSGRGGAMTAGTLCRMLAERIRHGSGLAGAMEATAGETWFGAVDIALVRSAEESGDMVRVLTDLADSHASADALRTRLATALAYPALLFVFGLGVVVFLTTTTLPQLAGVLQDAEVPLPAATEALLGFGTILTTRWPLALAGLLLLVGAIIWAVRSQALARVRLRLPLLGTTALRAQLALISQLLARLLEGGIPLADAVALVAPTVRNAALRSVFADLRARLQSGQSTAEHLKATGLFEPVFCRVLEVGEESGELPKTLRSIGERYRISATRRIDRLAAMLEPAVILLLAAAIGFVVYAAITPMLRLTQTL